MQNSLHYLSANICPRQTQTTKQMQKKQKQMITHYQNIQPKPPQNKIMINQPQLSHSMSPNHPKNNPPKILNKISQFLLVKIYDGLAQQLRYKQIIRKNEPHPQNPTLLAPNCYPPISPTTIKLPSHQQSNFLKFIPKDQYRSLVHLIMLSLLLMYFQFDLVYDKIGKDWKQIAKHIPSRTSQQVRSHAQKYLSRKLRKQNEQKQIRQAQKLIKQRPQYRETRSHKISQSYNQQQLLSQERAIQNIPSSKNKIDKYMKKPISVNTTSQEILTSKSLDQENSLQNTMKDPNRQHKANFIFPQPTIPMPLPNITTTSQVQDTSYLYQTLLPFLVSGMPLPLFIYNTNIQNQTNTITNQHNPKSLPVINQINTNTDTTQLQPTHQKYNPGFVRVKQHEEPLLLPTGNQFGSSFGSSISLENKKKEYHQKQIRHQSEKKQLGNNVSQFDSYKN